MDVHIPCLFEWFVLMASGVFQLYEKKPNYRFTYLSFQGDVMDRSRAAQLLVVYFSSFSPLGLGSVFVTSVKFKTWL